MSNNDPSITKGISLYPQDWAAIDAFAKDTGITRSSAIRMLIRRWLDVEREGQAATLAENRAQYLAESA